MTQLTTGILAHCADCGYDLRGQQASARCPECGRLNIPEAYRQEVHELVDSGRWFFSSPFSLFAKRPPGWFWSLDRPGDVGRSFRRAGVYIILSASIVAVAVGLADSSAVIRNKTSVYYPARRISKDTGKFEVLPGKSIVYHDVQKVGAFGMQTYLFGSHELVLKQDAPAPGIAASSAFSPGLNRPMLVVILLLPVMLFGTWMFPAMVGLWTQVRKGLPGFARASSTVIAACNYEAHRLIYAAAFVALLLTIETQFRMGAYSAISARGLRAEFVYISATIFAVFAASMIYAALGWLGALRSDFTKQIVRSRWHAARIIWMYSIGFTIVLTFNSYLLLRVLHVAG